MKMILVNFEDEPILMLVNKNKSLILVDQIVMQALLQKATF